MSLGQVMPALSFSLCSRISVAEFVAGSYSADWSGTLRVVVRVDVPRPPARGNVHRQAGGARTSTPGVRRGIAGERPVQRLDGLPVLGPVRGFVRQRPVGRERASPGAFRSGPIAGGLVQEAQVEVGPRQVEAGVAAGVRPRGEPLLERPGLEVMTPR